jgi:hypothetical protein
MSDAGPCIVLPMAHRAGSGIVEVEGSYVITISQHPNVRRRR